MRKNLKIILLPLIIMTAMCIFVGCGDGKQDDSALFPEQENQSAEQSTGAGNDEEQVNNEEQENDTKEEQIETEQSQPKDMQNQSAEEPLDESIDATADRSTDNNASTDEGTSELADTPTNDASDTSTDESIELSVYVESIGDNSVVGNKIFVETGVGGNGDIMLVGNGGDNKVLISIYFADDASYVYRIIRNGGADVETREGSCSDIKINMILDLTGYYKGEDFYADKVVISDVRTN